MKPLNDKQLIRLAEHYSENETCLFLNARVRELKVENGKKDAYIVELEERIKKAENQLKQQKGNNLIKGIAEAQKEVKSEEMYQNLKTQLESRKKEVARLHKQCSESATEICRLNAEIERLNNL